MTTSKYQDELTRKEVKERKAREEADLSASRGELGEAQASAGLADEIDLLRLKVNEMVRWHNDRGLKSAMELLARALDVQHRLGTTTGNLEELLAQVSDQILNGEK